MRAYTVPEAALQLGVTDNAVLQAIYRGALPATKRAGRYRIEPDDLKHYRQSRNRSLPRRRRKLSDEQVRTIRQYLDAGISQEQLAADFNVAQSTISNIARGVGAYAEVKP